MPFGDLQAETDLGTPQLDWEQVLEEKANGSVPKVSKLNPNTLGRCRGQVS